MNEQLKKDIARLSEKYGEDQVACEAIRRLPFGWDLVLDAFIRNAEGTAKDWRTDGDACDDPGERKTLYGNAERMERCVQLLRGGFEWIKEE